MRCYPYLPRGLVAAAVAACGLAAAGPALAWGAEGHRIVGLVAEQLLDAKSRAALQSLAGGESLATLGLWLDRERDRLRVALPGSERWHYDNRPVCEPAVLPQRYCADDQCGSRAYARALATLSDHRAGDAERLLALRIVVHVLADLHQPLHAADHDDRGGNSVEVRLGRGRPKPLHVAWDADFVKRAVRGESEPAFAGRLVAEHRADLARLESGTLEEWQAESYELARTYAYGRLPGFACARAESGLVELPARYADGAAEIAAERLARAGIRLAAVLRAAL